MVGRMLPSAMDSAVYDLELQNIAINGKPGKNVIFSSHCLFEEESSYADSDVGDTSFGREILQAVARNQISNTTHKRPILDDSTCSDLSDVLNDMNEYLDEQSTDTDPGPTPPKNSRTIDPQNKPYAIAPSHSFHYKRGSTSSSSNSDNNSPVVNKYSSPTKQHLSPQKQEKLPTHIVEGDATVPLLHTVSFYRRQQSQEQRTPVRQIQRQQAFSDESSPEVEKVQLENEHQLVEEKIKQLMDEVCKQQTVISQTSQALNLCCSTIEFSGSSEQVEAERLLLLATHRRQAALHETQRMRIERTLRPGDPNKKSTYPDVDHCSVSITDVTLPLKRDYIRALTAAGGLGHHLLCLVRYKEHVLVTPLMATGSPPNPPQDCVRISGTVKLDHVYPDFTITLEVYSMQAHEEILPHEVKYHIGANKKNAKLLTPKKLLKHQAHESKLTKTSIQSPAGPTAVRSPSFTMVGYVVFSIREINRTQWTLNKVPYTSPLEGSIQMKVQCSLSINVEMRGFLTMFEDVSGFGAWHRRWCLLKGHMLSYWKYPDDERRKTPIGSINLQGCITQSVGLVSRDICARPNTFQLEFVRPKQKGDTSSLVMVVKEDSTMIRNLLSADTKDERIEWCAEFNKALSSVKSW